MLLMGTDKPKGRNAGGEFGNAYHSGSMMLARTGPPTSHPPATPTTLPLFQKTLRPFSTWLAKANARKERP